MSPDLPYHSPSRSYLSGGLPCLVHPTTGVDLKVPIPAMMISLRENGSYDLWCFLPTTGKACSPKYASFPDLPSAVAALPSWFACPEKFAREHMGWTHKEETVVPKLPPPKNSTELSMDDFL